MGVIFMPKHMVWQRQKCAHIHSQIMHYHTGNFYYGVAPSVHVFGNLPDQETDDYYSNTTSSILFNNYHIILRYTAHGRNMLNDKKTCHMCK